MTSHTLNVLPINNFPGGIPVTTPLDRKVLLLASASERYAVWFNYGLGEPYFGGDLSAYTSVPVQAPSFTVLAVEDTHQWALGKYLADAIDALSGITASWSPALAGTKAKYAIIIDPDATATSVFNANSTVGFYLFAPPSAGSVSLKQVGYNLTTGGGSVPAENVYGWNGYLMFGPTATQDVTIAFGPDDDAVTIATKIAAAVDASAYFTAGLGVTAGTTWTVEVDFTSFNASATSGASNWCALVAATQTGSGGVRFLADKEIYDVWCSYDASGTAPSRGVDGQAELAIVNTDDAEDMADKFLAVVNTNWGTTFTATKLSANVVQVVSDSPFDYISSGVYGWDGISVVYKKDGSTTDIDPLVIVECVAEGVVPAPALGTSSFAPADISFSEITAGVNPSDAGWIEVEIDGTPLEALDHYDTSETYIEIDGDEPGGGGGGTSYLLPLLGVG